jgi:ribosomal protein S12 methylthiotransferase
MTEKTKQRSVGLISLGCPKNQVDSEILLGQLQRQGHRLVENLDEAETVIVNTCGFIDEAKEESIEAILEVAELKGKGVDRLLVAGCMVNRYGDQLAAEIPEIDAFVGLDDLKQVGELVTIGDNAPSTGPSHAVFDHTAPRVLTTRGYGYLKVAEGCDNPCTFCAIPSWRGRFRSRTIDSLVAEASELEASGVLELCLIAQDTTRYGEDLGLGRQGMVRLVESLLEATEIPWIRFLYAYPTTLSDDLLRLMGSEERFVSYIDMPLQHSHREILRAMQRGGSGDSYLRLLDRARTLAPDVFLRTTFIVGFPGETNEHFADLVDFVEAAHFDHLGCFTYSPQEGTPSAELGGRVPAQVAERRQRTLLETQRPISIERRQRLVGQRLEALIEGVCGETEHLLEGRHRGMAPEIDGRLLINEGAIQTPALAQVEITEAFADDLVGRVLGPTVPSSAEPAGTSG